MKPSLSLISAPLIILGTLMSTYAMSEEEWVVATDHAQCLLENAEAYGASGQEVMMIVLSACPDPDLKRAIVSRTRNAVIPRPDGSDTPTLVHEVIVYTRAEILCLASLHIDLSGPISRLPKAPRC